MTTFAISQPMKGKTAEQIKAAREEIIKEYEAKGWTFVDTYFGEVPDGVKSEGAWCLGKALMAFSQVDVVVFMPGWSGTRGCLVENDVCTSYHIAKIEL